MLPILFSIGSFHFYSLSIFLVLAWSTWSLLFWKGLREQGIDEEKIFDCMFWATLAALLASRMGYVFIHPQLFTGSWLKIVALWVVPGLSVYPGLAGGILTLLLLARRYGVRLGYVFDVLAFSLPGALAIGSVGVLFSGGMVGVPTRLPWALPVVGVAGLRHPVALYFGAVSLIILVIIALLELRAKKKDWPLGMLGVWYFLLFSISFFVIEFLVSDSVYLGKIRANQWMLLALCCQAIGAFYVRGGVRERARPIFRKGVAAFLIIPTSLYGRIRNRFTRRSQNKS